MVGILKTRYHSFFFHSNCIFLLSSIFFPFPSHTARLEFEYENVPCSDERSLLDDGGCGKPAPAFQLRRGLQST